MASTPKYSVILDNLGNTCDRFLSSGYKEQPSKSEMLRQAASIPGVKGIELVGTWDITDKNVGEMKTLLADAGLACVSIIPDHFAQKRWGRGCLHLPRCHARRAAVEETRGMMDAAVEPPGGKLIPQDMEPIKIVGSCQALSIKELKPGVYVFDFGQNIAGWCALRVSGKRGDTVVMRLAKILHDDGSIDQSNLRTAKATDTYILKCEMVEEWEPRFTYHGFQYVQVEGLSSAPDETTLTAKIIRSAVEPAGTFSCSDALITQINTNARWTEGNNLHSLPTDCPQRDERQAWLNDLTVRAEAAVHHFNLERLYAKFMDDIADTQDASGAISDTAPYKWGNRPADPVDVTFALLPWLLYTNSGDTWTIARHYPHLQGWFNCLSSLTKNDILEHSLYGNWAPPVAEGKDGSPLPAHTSGALISTGYTQKLIR